MKIQRRRGISPLIATIILIAITVIGGALVYTIFLSTSSSATGGVSVQLSSPTLSATGFSVNIKNSGTNAINGNSTIDITGGVACPIGGTGVCDTATTDVTYIAPGQTQTVVLSNPTDAFGPTVSSGTTYTITFIAQDTAGSTASFTIQVTAT